MKIETYGPSMRVLAALSPVLGMIAAAAPAAAQPPPGFGAPPPGYPAVPSDYQPPPGYQMQPGDPGYQPTPMAYQPLPQNPGQHRHDGFYLRLGLGPGYTAMSTEAAGVKMSIDGGGIGLNVALGGALSDNFIIYGELMGSMAINPTVEFAGATAQAQDASAGVDGLGVGVAYYVMPANFFIAGTLLASTLSVQDKDGKTIGETDVGGGLSLLAGKEWWVSDNWGIGVAAQFYFGTMKEKEEVLGEKPSWTALAFNLAFSATFN